MNFTSSSSAASSRINNFVLNRLLRMTVVSCVQKLWNQYQKNRQKSCFVLVKKSV